MKQPTYLIILLITSDWIWYGLIMLLLLVMLGFSLLKYFKKKTETGLLEKIIELEGIMGNQQFLYGNLNSIKQYILQHSPLEAAQYLTEFTNLLKTLSNSSKQKSITLSQEIETILLYLELEKKRVGEDFSFFQEIEANIKTEDIQVKPLFAFKQVEELIRKQQNQLKLHLVVKKVGERLCCKVESNVFSTNFVIEIPNKYSA
ncbi:MULTISPECIES: histidine kinase [Emticicia]|uniref:histidine kinase n=1 Tax=Emticicia TaxID=312278 RepID=UPI0007D8C75F|nr:MULTISPECIES: histidine kinase [Emticicia]